MNKDQTINLIDWFKEILLAFENFFHAIQAWFEGDIMKQDWFKNLTATDAEKESEAE
jgi:hypothetical protein